MNARLARAEKLRQLSHLRRQIRELEGQYQQLAEEEMQLGMHIDHLAARDR